MNNGFRWETELVEQFFLSRAWELVAGSGWTAFVAREFDGYFGVPDIMVALVGRSACGSLLTRGVAFEAKLKDWRKAIVQAYRYRAFCEYAYVVLDETYASPALEKPEAFLRAGIGLITMGSQSQVRVHYRAPHVTPYCKPLRMRLRTEVLSAAQTAGSPNMRLQLTSQSLPRS